MKNIPIFILLITALQCFSQKPKYEITYFSARDYGKGLEATNRTCVQDNNGILYFGNAGRIIQYDGTNWNFIPVKQENTWIFSLAISNENRIYVGAQNEFGYITNDSIGKKIYVSLSDSLSETKKVFSKIIRIHILKNQVVFQSEEALFIYSKGKINSILPETSFHLSFLVNNELYVRQRDIGLMKLDKDQLILLKGSEFVKNYGVFSIIKNADINKVTIITREDGFWVYDKITFKNERINTPDSALLRTSEIYGAILLNDGNIALNTLSNGIIITTANLEILNIVNKNNGLKVNGVQFLLQDYQGNIWAALNNGIAQIHYSSPISIYNSKNGITGIIYNVIRFNSNLFVGTTDGLFIQQNNDYSSSFTLYNNFNKAVKNLCIADNCLLVGTQSGLFQITTNGIIKIFDIDVSSMYYSDKLKLLFVAEKNGLVIYQHNGNWNKLINVTEIDEEIVHIEEEINPAYTNIWMGTPLQGIVRLQFTSPSKYVVDKYNSNDGLKENTWTIPYKIDNKVVFSQRSALLQFVDEETMKKQLPDSLKNRPEFYRGYFDFYTIDTLKEHQGIPYYVLEDTKDRIYTNLDNDLGFFDKSLSFKWVTKPFCLADIGKTNVFFHEDNGSCWIGGDDGLVLFNEKKDKNYSVDFNTLITKVTCTGDSVLYYGYSDTTHLLQQDHQLAITYNLNYHFNTLTFQFTAPFFEGQEKMLYSYILIGQDTAYSPWLPENKVTFSNLWEGDYTFKVRTKNIYGHISYEKVFRFTILSPWYRTIWAYILYTLLFVFFIYIGIRINSRRLIAKNKRLEAIILDRTQEIKQKNIVLTHQKEEILDSINYALRIQKAVLPDDNLTKFWLGEHFIIFKPKDIVSGDFYWTTMHHQHVFFCVADCTGHGVPGAFMSMLCISFLNEVVLKEEISQSEEILNKLRKMIIESLKQKGLTGEQKDGMDITLCVLNKESRELQFSGANNPLYIVRSNEKESIPSDKQLAYNDLILYEIKADAMPIAIHINMDGFKKHSISLLKDDRLFLFSDGFADQFGGTGGKKFMYKTFKTALLETCHFEIEDQKQQLEKRINDWMSFTNPITNNSYDQVDDICVMGVKV